MSMEKQNQGRLKVAMLGQKHTFSREGGIEVAVSELARRMARQGAEITCYDRHGHRATDTDDEIRKTGEGIRLRQVLTLGGGGLSAFTSSIAGALCASLGKYDVVHFHAEGPSAVCWLPKLFGKRVVCTIHGLDWKREKWGKLASSYILLGEKAAVKYADEIIVLNESTQRYFKTEYGRETRVIPNGVSRPERCSAELIRQAWELEPESYVLFVGRLVPEKGLRCLLDAWKEINTEKKLVIAGGSPSSESFLRELKEAAGSNVIFTGFVEGRALRELYSNAYLYVLPSDLEGMPLSLLEAMSYGNCCLISDIPGCIEAAGEHACRFKQGSASDLRDALRLLLSDRTRVEHFRDGTADYIINKYDWDIVAEKTLAVYRG